MVIKKLLLLLLTVGTFVMLIPYKEVDAMTVGEATWSNYNAYSTYFYAIASIEVPYNTGQVQFYIPQSSSHEFSYGGLTANVRFYDNLGDPFIPNINLIDLNPRLVDGSPVVDGYYSLDLIGLEVLGVTEIEFWIPQNYSIVPGDYTTDGGYLDRNDYLMFMPVAPYDIPTYWNNVNIYSTFYALETEITVPFNASSLQIYIPETAYHRFEYGATNSVVIFYDDADVILATVNLIDIADRPEGLMLIDFTSYGLNEVAKVKLRIMQSYSSMPSGYTDYMSEYTSVTFNANVKLAIYIVDNEEYDRKLFVDTPINLSVTKEGYTFEGWFFKNGVEYDFSSTISSTYIEFNSTVMLYARFTRTTTPPIFEEGTPANAVNNILSIFQLDNLLGYLLLYIGTTIGVIILLNIFKLPGVFMAVGMYVVTGFFIYLSILPTLMLVLGLAVDTMALIYTINRGD